MDFILPEIKSTVFYWQSFQNIMTSSQWCSDTETKVMAEELVGGGGERGSDGEGEETEILGHN